jgi:small-conductance mechanosensitive channel
MWETVLEKLRPFSAILELTYFHNRILDYLAVTAIFLAMIVAINIVHRVIIKHITKWVSDQRNRFANVAMKICENDLIPLLYFGAFYLSMSLLVIPDLLENSLYVIAVLWLTVVTIRALVSLVEHMICAHQEKLSNKEMISQGIMTLIKMVIWVLGIIFILDNLGFKISTVIAGLGIGGIAAALAAQTILGDLFNYFVILFDRPFAVGDFIVVGDYMGTVDYIGIKTTRIRSLSGEQLIFPNTDLTGSRVRNYKRMERRRVVFQVEVTYQTTLEQLKEIPAMISNIVKKIQGTQLDRVHFASYGSYSLVFEAVYYVLTDDYNKYMDTQQEINFAIKEEFARHKIEFAYPTQQLYVK